MLNPSPISEGVFYFILVFINMKYIISESQMNLLFEDYESEIESYNKIMNYRKSIGSKLTEIWNNIDVLKKLMGNKLYSENKNDGLKIMDYYWTEYKKNPTNNYFSCKRNVEGKNEIRLDILTKRKKIDVKNSQIIVNAFNKVQQSIKELNSIKPPKGYTPKACINAYSQDGFYKNDTDVTPTELYYTITFLYPIVPSPKKPIKPVVKNEVTPTIKKEIPSVKKDISPVNNVPQPAPKTKNVNGTSVFGPGDSLIGFMNGRDFIPATGQYVVGINKVDKDLLNNKAELNRYIQGKFGQYANPIN